MLSLIERALPRPLHRRALQIAYRVRHRWRKIRKARIAGCSVVISDLGGQVLLLRHSYGPAVWALPGGGLKRGENPADAAKREVLEEVGIELGRVHAIGKIEEVISGAPHVAHVFAAVSDRHPRPDEREVVEARFFPPHSLPEPLGEATRRRLAFWREHSGR
jgi:ADP-ribose pyrophosphatase YjhB (NUDIX family)